LAQLLMPTQIQQQQQMMQRVTALPAAAIKR
jgi:hypothetical protein